MYLKLNLNSAMSGVWKAVMCMSAYMCLNTQQACVDDDVDVGADAADAADVHVWVLKKNKHDWV